MRLLFASAALLFAVGLAGPVHAQERSCGGLLCDMGVFGEKRPPAPSPEAAPPPAPVVAAPAPVVADPEPAVPTRKVRTVRKKKRTPKLAAEPARAPAAAKPQPVQTAEPAPRAPPPAPTKTAGPPPAAPPAAASGGVDGGDAARSLFRPLY